MNEKRLDDFNLVGGTALSLQLGHRVSVDIDLFSTNSFNAMELSKILEDKYQAYDIKVLTNGVFC